jgi:tetratricopeptide (TPR) repeat protein
VWKFKSFFLVAPFVLSILVLILSIYWLPSEKKHQPKSSPLELERQFEEIKHLYQQGRLEDAREQMKSKESSLILLSEGCELVLSVYARLDDFEPLKNYSERCFKHPTNRDIAYEGYGKSSFKLGTAKEAIKVLEEELKKHKSDRLLAVIAELCFFEKDYPNSRDYFKKLIKNSPMWQAWLYRIMKFPPLLKSPEFVETLTYEVSQKKEVSKTVEEQLLSYAKAYKLSNSVLTLEKRLKTKIN